MHSTAEVAREQLAESLEPYGTALLEDGRIERDLGVFVNASTLPDEGVRPEPDRRCSLRQPFR